MSRLGEQGPDPENKLSDRARGFVQRLYRDPRYLLIGKMERFGRELIAFVEGCTMISATGEVRGQALINAEHELHGRPDGERPYQEDSLVEYYLSPEGKARVPLGDDDFVALREESWQYYVRRNFAFLLGDFAQARDDAEHNLAIWNLIEQSDASEEAKWSYLRWWPWIERDRAVAEALLGLEHGQREEAAAELYRAQRAVAQYHERYAERYAQEEEDGKSLSSQMNQHIASLIEILQKDDSLPVSTEEQLDEALARGDEEEVERLRREMIRRAMGE
jgi:molybdenum-dependent DNA-binding transcriptional regulator ModE